MINVVIDQDAFRRSYRAFHCGKLTGDIETGLLLFNHADNAPKVALSAF